MAPEAVESIDAEVRILPTADSEEQILNSLRRCKELVDSEAPDEEITAEVSDSKTGKTLELRYKNLTAPQRKDMDAAMIKQLDAHFKYNAVEGVKREEQVPKDRMLDSRLLCTNNKSLPCRPSSLWLTL